MNEVEVVTRRFLATACVHHLHQWLNEPRHLKSLQCIPRVTVHPRRYRLSLRRWKTAIPAMPNRSASTTDASGTAEGVEIEILLNWYCSPDRYHGAAKRLNDLRGLSSVMLGM